MRNQGRETPFEVDGVESQDFAPDVNPPLAQMGRDETLLVRQLLERLSSIDRIILEFLCRLHWIENMLRPS